MIDLTSNNTDQLYDLFRKLYSDKGAEWEYGNGRINIIGVRGLQNKKEVEFNANNVFNDSIYLVYKDADGNKVVKEYEASCEPGKNAVKNKQDDGGAAYLSNGIHKFLLGWHNKYKDSLRYYDEDSFTKKCYQCLEPDPSVQVHRIDDKDNDGRITEDEISSDTSANKEVQIHYGGDASTTEYNNDTKSWSYGCNLIKNKEKYKEFLELLYGDTSIRRKTFADNITKYDSNSVVIEGTRSVNYLLLPVSDLAVLPESYSLPVDIANVDTTKEVTKEFINKYYTHNEQEFDGGYFPVGGNTSWHGGVHIIATDGAPVRAVADGEIVCARVPVTDPNQDKLNYGSRNFVMIKHSTNDKTWFSVYYHLKSTSFDSEEAKSVVWWKCKSLKLKKNRNFRKVPGSAQNEVIRLIEASDASPVECEIIKQDGKWIEVRDPQDGQVGFIYFAADRMEIIEESVSDEWKDKFSEGDGIFQVNKKVKSGDIIGYVGEGVILEDNKPVKKPLLHWTILSNDLFDPNWNQVTDTDDDYTCNSVALVNLVDKNDDEKITVPEVIEFYSNEENAKKIRPYACKFTSEWAVDWKKFATRMQEEGVRAVPATLELYNFWKDAAKCDDGIASDGNVWHYNPITFLEKLLFATARATFTELFQADKTFPLPAKLKKLGKKIGSYLSNNTIKNLHFILHSGIEGDTLDAKELSQKRAEVIEGYFKPNKDFFAGEGMFHAKKPGWGDRERKIMMSFVKNPDGKSYGSFPANDDPIDEAFKDIVRQYQKDYSLGVDGGFGPESLTKAIELLLEETGLNELPEIVVTVAGDNHPEESSEDENADASGDTNESSDSSPEGEDTASPKRIMEVILWKDNIEPAVDEYEWDAAGVYEKWGNSVTIEIQNDRPIGNGVWFENSEDAPFYDEDSIVLLSGGTEVQRFKISERTKEEDGYLFLPFNKISSGENYTLHYEMSDPEGQVSTFYVLVDNISGDLLMGLEEPNENETHEW